MFDGGDLGLWSKSEQHRQPGLHCRIDGTAGFHQRFHHVRFDHYFSYYRVNFGEFDFDSGNHVAKFHFDLNCGLRAVEQHSSHIGDSQRR